MSIPIVDFSGQLIAFFTPSPSVASDITPSQNVDAVIQQKSSGILSSSKHLKKPTKKRNYSQISNIYNENPFNHREGAFTFEEIKFLIEYGIEKFNCRKRQCFSEFTKQFPNRHSKASIRFKLDTILTGRNGKKYSKRIRSWEKINFIFNQGPPENTIQFQTNYYFCLEKYSDITQRDYIFLVINLYSGLGDRFKFDSFDNLEKGSKRCRKESIGSLPYPVKFENIAIKQEPLESKIIEIKQEPPSDEKDELFNESSIDLCLEDSIYNLDFID